jgi:hypothetical protein
MVDQFLRLIKLPELIKKRVIFLWSLNFLYQVGFIIAWVVITALYLQTFGIQNLIWLFLVEAVLLLTGSLIGRPFFLRYSVNKFLYVVTALVIVSVLAEYALRNQPVIFFGVALIAKSLLYPQFRIAFFRKTESFFSPNSARLALPIVETAHTIGTIFSSVVVIVLLEFFQTYEVFYFWLVPLIGMLALCAFESKFIDTIEDLTAYKPTKATKQFSWNMYKKFRTQPFIMLLVGLILAKAALFTVVEYEFTKEVNTHFTEKHETVTISWDYMQANLLQSAKKSASGAIHTSKEFISDKVDTLTSQNIAHENIAHDLGILSFIFGMIALVMKLFVTRRVMERFGIFKTIFIYFSGMLWWIIMLALGQTDMRFVRGYEHGFFSLFASPYHLNFYGSSAEDREIIRHGLEGVIQPIGNILGVGLVLSLHWWNLPLSFGMLGLCLLVIWIVYSGYGNFGRFTLTNFFATKNVEEKISILEVIGHPRSDAAPVVLARRVVHQNQHPILRKKIILTLEKMQQPEVIHSYLNILGKPAEDTQIKIHILESLLLFPRLKKYCQSKAFTDARLLETLKELFASTTNKHLKKLVVMNIFQHISNHKTVAFLQQSFEESDDEMMAIMLRSCMNFNDPEIISFLSPLLKHKNPRVQSHAIMACWRFGNKQVLESALEELFHADDEAKKISAIYAVGELRLHAFTRKLKRFSNKTDGVMRVHTLIALLKLDRREYIKPFIEIVLGPDDTLAIKAFRMRKRLPLDIKEKLETAVYMQVSKQIHAIIKEQDRVANWLQKISLQKQLKLKRLYSIVGGYESIYVLEQLEN